MKLRRTVPFVATARAIGSDSALLVDRVEAPLGAATNTPLLDKLVASLDLGPADRCVDAAEAERLVGDQYDACLEYVYSHPLWEQIRDGSAQRELRSYLIETRHYLAAASFRMATGISGSLRPNDLIRLQAHHVVEEADHDRFFENGLVAMGCDQTLVRSARPAPPTVEWIHLMRTVAEYGPLAAGLCSGLLETTARDTESVAGWHEMLSASGQLSTESVDAIFEHVGTDLGLGHGSNWRKALQAAKVIPVAELAAALNAVTVVAEMIRRWLDTLTDGLAGDVVGILPKLAPAGAGAGVLGGEADGLPVWPANVLDAVTHGGESTSPAVRATVGLAYAYAGRVTSAQGSDVGAVVDKAAELAARVAVPASDETTPVALEKLVSGWMTTIDGHRLWSELLERPTVALTFGWQLENLHYIAAIWQHNGAAVAACPDPVIRERLVHHLVEEFNHAKLFRRGLVATAQERYPSLRLDDARPLPTTVAFTGALRGLGQHDWKAYVLAMSFLQLSLQVGSGGLDDRHEGFYSTLLDKLPDARPLVDGMRRHDAEDSGLGHASDIQEMLALLGERHPIGRESVAGAALIAQLTWSFLDGIRGHYSVGDAAVVARMGWHAGG